METGSSIDKISLCPGPPIDSNENEESITSDKNKGELGFLRIDWRIQPFEIAFLVLGSVYVAIILHSHLPFNFRILNIFLLQSLKVVFLVYGLSLIVIAFKAYLLVRKNGREVLYSSQTRHQLILPYWSLNFLISTFRRVLTFFGAIFLFLHMKHLILFINPSNHDLFYWNLDRTLHFGVQPNVWMMQKLGPYQEFAVLIDWLYIEYFHFKLIASVILLMECKGRELTNRFFLAYILTWMLGGLAYLVTPADGPVYAALLPHTNIPVEAQTHIFKLPMINDLPQDYIDNFQASKIWIAKNFQTTLWTDRQKFLHGERLPGVFYGISAMPSLHVAGVVLCAFFLWKTSIILGLVSLLYVIAMCIGSVFLQWHYAVDGYVGATLTLSICLFATKLPERFFERQSC